jgi:AraC-like DNA-binding protein
MLQKPTNMMQSPEPHDPLSELIHMLRPRSTRWRAVEAAGDWALGFHARHDLLFCLVTGGSCLLLRPEEPPHTLAEGDFALLRTDRPCQLASIADAPGPPTPVTDSEAAYLAHPGTTLRLGTGPNRPGPDRPVTIQGGRFFFDPANRALLTPMLPSLSLVRAADPASWRIHALLRLNADESAHPRLGTGFLLPRLMELVLVEILRDGSTHRATAGLLAGLADPVLAPALRALHSRPAHRWTVSTLARLAHQSRSAFAQRFRSAVGTGPIEYLSRWRLALARDQLRHTTRTLAEIAEATGFSSASALSHAFSRAEGRSPRHYRANGTSVPT